MTRDDVLRELRNQPFRPFRIVLSSGESFDIRHPDMAIPTLGAVYIARPSPANPSGGADDIFMVSLNQLLKIEYMTPMVSSPTS